MKFYKLLSAIWITLNMTTIVYAAGYGIDCNKPYIPNTTLNMTTAFHFTCTNNTPATFNGFNLFTTELDTLPPANITLSIIWPHSASNIRPGDVGTVNGTITTTSAGAYYFDFTKAYGGETYSGIFCKNKMSSNCVTVQSMMPVPTAYITNFNFGNVSKCTIANNGNLNNCSTAVTGLISARRDIVVNPSQSFAYITTQGGSIYKCDFLANNNLSCTTLSGVSFTSPFGITLNPAGTRAYIAEYFSDDITKCDITAQGNFINCASTGSGFHFPASIAINNSNTIAYITNVQLGFTGFSKCNIDANGDFTGCVITLATGFFPYDIALKTVGTDNLAYVTTAIGNGVFKCGIDGSGDFTTCTFMATGFGETGGITINEAGTIVYITDINSNTVFKCGFDLNNDLVNCIPTGSDFNEPTALAIRNI